MARPALSRPTDGDVEILRVLWSEGPSTVRTVHNTLDADCGYNSVLKRMQIMETKGYIKREPGRPARYVPMAESATKGDLIKDLINRVFEGSPASLVKQLLSSTKISASEMTEIKKALSGKSSKR